MRYVTVQPDASTDRLRWGVEDDGVIRLAPEDGSAPATLLDAIRTGQTTPGANWVEVDAQTCRHAAPLPQPARNILCLGLNYADHAEESQKARGRELELPEHPVVFTKATGTVTGPGDDIPLDPAVTEQFDWEVEMAVVIGRRARHLTARQAEAAVFGYTVVNDLSARDLQFRHKQFFLGKSVDDSCPMGPAIVTPEAVGDPHEQDLECRVNGVVKQASNTRHLVFRIPDILVRLSAIMTLEPGDVIATGTPAGVGFARQPPEFLQHGDTVTSTVAGIGTLENRIVPA